MSLADFRLCLPVELYIYKIRQLPVGEPQLSSSIDPKVESGFYERLTLTAAGPFRVFRASIHRTFKSLKSLLIASGIPGKATLNSAEFHRMCVLYYLLML